MIYNLNIRKVTLLILILTNFINFCWSINIENAMERLVSDYSKSEFIKVKKRASSWIAEAVEDQDKEITEKDTNLLYYGNLWLAKAHFCSGYIDSALFFIKKNNSLLPSKVDFERIPSHYFSLESLDSTHISKYFKNRFLTIGELQDDQNVEAKILSNMCQLEKEKENQIENITYFVQLPSQKYLEKEYINQLNNLINPTSTESNLILFETYNAVINRCMLLRGEENRIMKHIFREINKNRKELSLTNQHPIIFDYKHSFGGFVHIIKNIPSPFKKYSEIDNLTFESFYGIVVNNEQLISFTNFSEEDYSDKEGNNPSLKIFWDDFCQSKNCWKWGLRDIKDVKKIIILIPYSIDDQDYYIYKNNDIIKGHLGILEEENQYDYELTEIYDLDDNFDSAIKILPDSTISDIYKLVDSQLADKLVDSKLDIPYNQEGLRLMCLEYTIQNREESENLIISLDDNYGYYEKEQKKKRFPNILLGISVILSILMVL